MVSDLDRSMKCIFHWSVCNKLTVLIDLGVPLPVDCVGLSMEMPNLY